MDPAPKADSPPPPPTTTPSGTDPRASAVNAASQASTTHRHSRRSSAERDAAQFTAFALVSLAVVIGLCVQCAQLITERRSLSQSYATQTRAMEEAMLFRTSLHRLAFETQTLVEKGLESGQLLVDELRKRGIVIDLTADPPVIQRPPRREPGQAGAGK